MTITIKQTVYEPIPEGLYPATITSIEEEPNGKFGPQLLVKFSLDPFKDYPDGCTLGRVLFLATFHLSMTSTRMICLKSVSCYLLDRKNATG
jgi:hypothetical protein